MPGPKRKTTIWLGDEEAAWLHQAAFDQGRTMSDLIREGIGMLMASPEARRVSRARPGSSFDQMLRARQQEYAELFGDPLSFPP